MAGIINTNKVLNSSWNSGDGQQALSGPIMLDPAVAKQYDYSMTEDPILLQDRNETNEILYDIFTKSPYYEKYKNNQKIDKSDISDIFYYFKGELEKRKKISAYEMVIAINEFFDFNYKYIVDNVLTINIKAQIYNDYYNNMGMKERMNNAERLF